jgi:uncharacterized membrane protein
MRSMGTLELMTFVSTIGCGLIGGFLFAFSVCVMKALGKLPPAQGIAAMQSINVVIINPWFLSLFLGLAVPCAWLCIAALRHWSDARAPYWLAGSLLYLVGAILVTMFFNVPRNNALAELSPSSADAPQLWASYLSSWTAWNHVRTVASLAAAALFAIALRVRA